MTTRDMTRQEFKTALARNGFRLTVLGWWAECDELPGVSLGTVYNPKNGRMLRRDTIAHLIRERDRRLEQREKGEI